MVFLGTVTSDFLKLIHVEDVDKQNLINFSETDFIGLRNSLIAYIKAVYPLEYTYFSESDLGIMLTELVAYMGSVLSFKADYLANENYLSSAQRRDSVQNLMNLIGVRMRGPIAAAANAKITLDLAPAWVLGSHVSLTPQQRTIIVKSPEDSLAITYTIYKVSPDGNIDTVNNNGAIDIFESEKSSSTTIENLIILEGSLIVESGNFNRAETVKIINLTQSPIIEGSITVAVIGNSPTAGEYKQVRNLFFATSPTQKIFQVQSSESYGGSIIFGGGLTGQSPAQDDSYVVTYRVGGGSRGNIPPGYINARSSLNYYSSNLANSFPIEISVENTSKGTGGSDAESIAHVKKYGPLSFKSLDRLVTLSDYKTFANNYITSYGSVGKAVASTRRAYSSANIIDIFVLEKSNNIQLRKSTPEFKRQLTEAMIDKKMITDEIVIVDGLIRTLDLMLVITLDKKYEITEKSIMSKISKKIETFFDVENSDFGKEFIPLDLMHSIFEVEEVRFAYLENITDTIVLNFNEIIQLNNYNFKIVYV